MTKDMSVVVEDRPSGLARWETREEAAAVTANGSVALRPAAKRRYSPFWSGTSLRCAARGRTPKVLDEQDMVVVDIDDRAETVARVLDWIADGLRTGARGLGQASRVADARLIAANLEV